MRCGGTEEWFKMHMKMSKAREGGESAVFEKKREQRQTVAGDHGIMSTMIP